MKRLVIGILAHVDSGKTTLSETMFYMSGEIRKLGRVDHENAFLDIHFLEKERGITIFSKQALMHYNDTEITMLDTLGHVDFSTEMERTLGVLDYAILVVSGSDGVQSHTETLWKLLKTYNVPTFIFVNKMDLSGANKNLLISEFKHRFNQNCIDFTDTLPLFYENLSLCDDKLLDEYLEADTINDVSLRKAIAERKVFPCYWGSALKLYGIEEFLNGLVSYTENIEYGHEFGARVFKISEDEQGNRLTHLKITAEVLK